MAVTKSFVACVLFAAFRQRSVSLLPFPPRDVSGTVSSHGFAEAGTSDSLTSFGGLFLTATSHGAYIFNEVLANAEVNIFTVLDANGNVLPNASVQPIPEPATWVLFS